MKDRLVEHANRYRLTPVKGADNIYDIEPTPGEVTEEGTLINKSTLLKDSTAALYGLPKTLGDAEVGEILKLNVGGVPTEFIVVQQGLPSSMYDESCNGTWLLMKDGYTARQWHSSNVNDYANSDINKWLNNDFIALLDSDIQDAVKTVKIPYRPGSGMGATVNSGATGLSVKAFLLSWLEIGFNSLNSPIDGVRLDYFDLGDSAGASNRTKRIANYNGTPVIWCTRSPYCAQATYLVWGASSVGSETNFVASNPSVYVRPALVLPSTLHITLDRDVTISTDPVPDDVFSKIHDMLGGYKIRRTLDGYNNLYSVGRPYQMSVALNDGKIAETITPGYWYRIYNADGTHLWNSQDTSSAYSPDLAIASKVGSSHYVVRFGSLVFCDTAAFTSDYSGGFAFATDNYYGCIYVQNSAIYVQYCSYGSISKTSISFSRRGNSAPYPLACIGDKVYFINTGDNNSGNRGVVDVFDCTKGSYAEYGYDFAFLTSSDYFYNDALFIDNNKAYIFVWEKNANSGMPAFHYTPLIINLEDMSSNVSNLTQSDISGYVPRAGYYRAFSGAFNYIGSNGEKHYFFCMNSAASYDNRFRVVVYDESAVGTNQWQELKIVSREGDIRTLIECGGLSSRRDVFTPHKIEWKIPEYENKVFLDAFIYDMNNDSFETFGVYGFGAEVNGVYPYGKYRTGAASRSFLFSAYQFAQQNQIITKIPDIIGMTYSDQDQGARYTFGGKSLHYDVEITPQ